MSYPCFILTIAFCAGVLGFCFHCVAERLFHSRVLRPPGGGSNISLGADEEKPPVRKNKMASSVFAEPEDPYANRRNNPPGTIQNPNFQFTLQCRRACFFKLTQEGAVGQNSILYLPRCLCCLLGIGLRSGMFLV